VLPESLPKADRQPFTWETLNSYKQLKILGRSKIFLRLALTLLISGVVGAARGRDHSVVLAATTVDIIPLGISE
jgi:hypothetical protein